MPGLIETLVMLGITIGIFLLLRSIMLWYWKIDTIVNNQIELNKIMKEQKDLLERIYLGKDGHSLPENSDEDIKRKAKLYDEAQRLQY